MNPNAKEFSFNAAVPSWTPAGASTAPPQPPASKPVSLTASLPSSKPVSLTASLPSSKPVSLTASLPSSKPAAAPVPVAPVVVEETVEDDGEEEIDEEDPLWKATLSLAKGDRKAALKLLEDPDALMSHPEIKAFLESSEETWESSVDEVAVATSEIEISEPAEKVKSAETPKESAASSPVPGEKEEEVVESSVAILDEVDPREHLNIVFIGHVDAGKSTLSGSILYLMGMVDKRTIERFEREAKDRNRESWFLAFIMDTSEEERSKGITVEVGRAHFETPVNRYSILDAPGHKNYVPNMIAGATQADVGVLVISARRGEFETGFEKGGQTREHALLAKTLGVQHLIVVINKMDDPTVMWEQARFEECVMKLKPYLKQVGYTIKTDVKFIPISALSGDNVLNEVPSSKCDWWKKLYTSGGHNTFTPTLISTLDALKVANRDANGPLRIPCLDRYAERGCVVLGKVESGTLRVGDEVVIAPTKKKAKVEEISIGEVMVRTAKPGENVLVKFQIDVEYVQKGYVLCSPNNLCPAPVEIKVQLLLVEMLEHRPLLTPGYDCVMHVHCVEIEVTCTELISVVDKGKAMRRPFARTGQMCTARLVMPLSTCMETFENRPSMARITLRDEGRTIAIGKILECIKPKA